MLWKGGFIPFDGYEFLKRWWLIRLIGFVGDPWWPMFSQDDIWDLCPSASRMALHHPHPIWAAKRQGHRQTLWIHGSQHPTSTSGKGVQRCPGLLHRRANHYKTCPPIPPFWNWGPCEPQSSRAITFCWACLMVVPFLAPQAYLWPTKPSCKGIQFDQMFRPFSINTM